MSTHSQLCWVSHHVSERKEHVLLGVGVKNCHRVDHNGPQSLAHGRQLWGDAQLSKTPSLLVGEEESCCVTHCGGECLHIQGKLVKSLKQLSKWRNIIK